MYEGQSNRRLSTLQRRACYDLNLNMTTTSIRENLPQVQERISAAAQRAGRPAEEITLIGVSKTHPAEAIREAYEAGLRHFGENRVQEWEGKQGGIAGFERDLASDRAFAEQQGGAGGASSFMRSIPWMILRWRNDWIGHGARSGVTRKLRVLHRSTHRGGRNEKRRDDVKELPALAEKIAALPMLELAGLMCIPPFAENAEQARPHFRRLRELRDELAKQLGRGAAGAVDGNVARF